MSRRILILAALVCLVPAVASAAAPNRSWALPQIKIVLAHGLMGEGSPSSFRPDDPLTKDALDGLVAGLAEAVPPTEPTPGAVEPEPDPATPDNGLPSDDGTDPRDDPSSDDSVPLDPEVPTISEVRSSTPAPASGAAASTTVTMTQLDARLVGALGLSREARQFTQGAKAAGLVVPGRFGTEVTARLLGLRTNHPATLDGLELLPNDPATRAEAAYSAAQILGFRGWEPQGLETAAASFVLPQYTPWQKRILDTAVRFIGYPYIWGGTSENAETLFGVSSRGGFDCSGFVWRVYKLQPYDGADNLTATLRGRTTYEMSGEVPRAKRIPLAKIQPGDVLFWGAHGPKSKPSEVDHAGIYLGNGWFIHSSGYGVAVAQLQGWYADRFAWARRPLAEAGLA